MFEAQAMLKLWFLSLCSVGVEKGSKYCDPGGKTDFGLGFKRKIEFGWTKRK